MGPVRVAAVLAELLAMIGGDDHDGVVAQAGFVEPVEQSSDFGIRVADFAVVVVHVDARLIRALGSRKQPRVLFWRRIGRVDLVGVQQEEEWVGTLLFEPSHAAIERRRDVAGRLRRLLRAAFFAEALESASEAEQLGDESILCKGRGSIAVAAQDLGDVHDPVRLDVPVLEPNQRATWAHSGEHRRVPVQGRGGLGVGALDHQPLLAEDAIDGGRCISIVAVYAEVVGPQRIE